MPHVRAISVSLSDAETASPLSGDRAGTSIRSHYSVATSRWARAHAPAGFTYGMQRVLRVGLDSHLHSPTIVADAAAVDTARTMMSTVNFWSAKRSEQRMTDRYALVTLWKKELTYTSL